MPSLKTIGAFIITGLLAALSIVSARAKKAKAERDQAQQDAAIAKQVNETHKAIDKTARKMSTKHQQETKDEKANLAKDNRNQLDNNW